MDNTYIRDLDADVNGTSFHDVEIRASLKKLTGLFGAPCKGYDKTKHEWVLRGPMGVTVTIYDYKYNGAREEYWHVGARTSDACTAFARWFAAQ